MERFSAESKKTEAAFEGDLLIPGSVDQDGPECVLRAIINGGQMEMRRVCFSKNMKCDLLLDCSYFKYLYERETRVTLTYDRTPRIGRGLRLFMDMGIQAWSPTLPFPQPPVVHLPDFRPYPPKIDHITGQLLNGLDFAEVMDIINQDKPVLGSFAVDENFGKLGPEDIYDFRPSADSKYATHCVMFMDGGFDKVKKRNYLKFLNSHGPGFGAHGFGRVYFDLVYQTNSEFCFHTLSFEDPPTSSQHALPRAVSASSTADSTAETHDKQGQFGVTPAALMDPMTHADYRRSHELQQFLASHLSPNSEDSAMREALLQLDEGTSAIFRDLGLSCVDEGNISILDQCKAAAMVVEIVPNIENYRIVLQCVNFWATRRSIHSNMNGFLGGIHWAILVARICQIFPRAIPSVLLSKFFEEYSHWFWPNPVMLCLIEKKVGDVDVWDAPTDKLDRSHLMPIITPTYPCRNSSADVSQFTLLLLKQEFMLGFEISKKIEKGEAHYSDLFEPLGFFKLYGRYLQLDINVKCAHDLRIWKRKVESLWRELPLMLCLDAVN